MIKIIDVNVSSNYSWGDVKSLRNWNNFKNANNNWQQTKQTVIVGHDVFISIKAVENNWLGLMKINRNWEDIFNNYINWNQTKNF